MTPRSLITRITVAAVGVTAGMVVGTIVFSGSDSPSPAPSASATTPALPPVPDELVMEQARAGRSCAPEPVLTDHIIFTFLSGETTVLDFDEAYAAAESGEGHVRLYCSEDQS